MRPGGDSVTLTAKRTSAHARYVRRRTSTDVSTMLTLAQQITSDDQAQDFCKYWIETAKEEFNGASYLNGGVDADKGSIYCVYVTKG